MRRRLRKKLHVREFQEMGFSVSFQCLDDREKYKTIMDEFILLAIEANGLAFGGGGTPPICEGFICVNGRGSCAEDHRKAIQHWLDTQSAITESHVGPLVDAWYGPFDGDSHISNSGD